MPPNNALRIAMVSYYLPSKSKIGVGYQAHALANGMARRGHEVTLYSSCGPTAGAEYDTKTIDLTGGLRTFRFATEIRRLDLSGYDVLHAHGDDYWLWRRRVPAHVRTMHGSCLSEAVHIRGAKERLRMFALGLGEELASIVADRTVVVSPSTRGWMPWVRTVVPNGVDRNVFFPDGERSSMPSILFVGTYGQRKRGRLLMDAFTSVVRPSMPEAELWMVSDAPTREGVIHLGRVSETELVQRYRSAWLFCLPSSYEGFGIPYAEALSCGTPVVATPNPGSRFVLDDGRAGCITPPDRLGATLLDLLSRDDQRQHMTAAGLARAEAFSMESVLDRYEEIYRDLINKRRGTP